VGFLGSMNDADQLERGKESVGQGAKNPARVKV
jgi:hypothetical protein